MFYIIIGFFSGIIGGMGIGGGTILIPALVFFVNVKQQLAQSVNLLSFIPLCLIAIPVHLKNKNIDKKVAISIIIPGLIGSLIGSIVAISLSSVYLKKIFGVFLLIIGVYQLVSKST
ncbi:MAG TPA: sulfite exporter TauE/SafE family protein [Eubacteriaceae bacterium]|nr:sulfite exporter TauE/SafE family protein [Eubacteriaceae bacterium]